MIETIEQLVELLESKAWSTISFNTKLLWLFKENQITVGVFNEYLEITQADIEECLGEAIGREIV